MIDQKIIFQKKTATRSKIANFFGEQGPKTNKMNILGCILRSTFTPMANRKPTELSHKGCGVKLFCCCVSISFCHMGLKLSVLKNKLDMPSQGCEKSFGEQLNSKLFNKEAPFSKSNVMIQRILRYGSYFFGKKYRTLVKLKVLNFFSYLIS